MKHKFVYCLIIALACLAPIQTALAQGLTFTTSTYSVGSEPLVAVGAVNDVNGDGRLDVLVGNWKSNNITVLTNNGLGNFGYYATISAGTNPEVTLADVNGDGKPYMITVNNNNGGPGTVTVLTNNGFGIYSSNAIYAVGTAPQDLLVADINGDGKLDLICADGTSNPGTVSVLTNNGYGAFGSNATLNVGNSPQRTVAADVNSDGYVDLMTVNQGSGTITVLTNNGHAGFGLSQTLTTGKSPQGILATDVNGDGYVDLVCANVGTNTLTIFTNNGRGIFGLNATPTVGNKPSCVVAADLNGDGNIDLISANSGGWASGNGNTLTVLTNNGYGVFGSNTTLTVGTLPFFLVAADVNADGKPDLVTANFKDNTVTVLLNTTIFPSAKNRPTLATKVKGTNIRVSWPSVSAGWELQENPDLTKPVWQPSGYDGWTIADDGTNKSLTVPSQIGNCFFRLLHP